MARLRAPDPRPRLEQRPRAAAVGLPRRGHRQRRVRDRVLRRRRRAVHPRARAALHRVRPLARAADGGDVPEPPVPAQRDVGRPQGGPDPAARRHLRRADHLGPPHRRARARALLLRRPADHHAVGPAHGPLPVAHRRLLRRRGRRAAPERRDGRSRVPRAVPDRRPQLGRHPLRPAVHPRGVPRVRAVTAVGARRVRPPLRRVGRLLRPRPPAGRARRPALARPGERLRPDRVPGAGDRRVAPRRPTGVEHTRSDHTSVLRFLEWRFLGAPARGPGGDGRWWLTRRDRHAHNLGTALAAGRSDPELGVRRRPPARRRVDHRARSRRGAPRRCHRAARPGPRASGRPTRSCGR